MGSISYSCREKQTRIVNDGASIGKKRATHFYFERCCGATRTWIFTTITCVVPTERHNVTLTQRFSFTFTFAQNIFEPPIHHARRLHNGRTSVQSGNLFFHRERQLLAERGLMGN
jgi:hypothetical protein